MHTNEDHYYVIHPLPKRFRNATSNPHLLFQKSHRITNNQDCPHYKTTSNSNNATILNRVETKDVKIAKDESTKSLRRRKRETFPDGAPAFVETAVFVDKDLFEHMKTNFPSDTERELIRFVLAMINAVCSF